MTKQLSMAIGLLLAGFALASEIYPRDVSEYIERREVCEHFRAEPWPEGGSSEERERRDFIAAQLLHYCKGSDQAIRELKAKYRDNRVVMDRLETYEADIEGKQVCAVQGEVIQWVADYCMLKMQTDDEIAVSDCIEDSRRTSFSTECAAKIYYKRVMCALSTDGEASAMAIEKCLADPAFMGRTVRHGGVGG